MKKRQKYKSATHPVIRKSIYTPKQGFTLIEVILVLVVIVIISGISLPYFAGSLRGNKLRTSARTIGKMSRYARSMAIMRDETMTVVINHETMEAFVGGYVSRSTDETDGEIDQDVLKRLGYVDNDDDSSPTGGVEQEISLRLPDNLTIKTFEKEWYEDEDDHESLYFIRFYPNGQCEWFELEVEDKQGAGVRMEIDPISGKVSSEFIQ